MKTVNILMVCLGNICRSPLAEGVLASKLDPQLFTVDSAGTAAYHTGSAPDRRSQQVALKYGIEIGHQQARPFEQADFDRFDHIFFMDRSNYIDLKALQPTNEQWKKVKLLCQNQEVPDPYYGNNDGFERVYQMIDQATDRIVKEVNPYEK